MVGGGQLVNGTIVFGILMTDRVRAILQVANHVILIKRQKPNMPTYWVAPGGGIESHENHQQALKRELYEELGAQIEINQQVLVVPDIGGYQFFYQCTLIQMNLANQCGSEFDDVARGVYSVEHIPLQIDILQTLNILPSALKEFLVIRRIE